MSTEDTRKLLTYPRFAPPAQLADRPPWEWKPAEAKDYFEWFLRNVDSRVDALAAAVAETGSADWLDHTPSSLAPLGEWLEKSIVVTKKSAAQKGQEIETLPPVLQQIGEAVVEGWSLTPESLSIAVDVGIYLGEVFRKNMSGVRWVLCSRPKSDASYQQPVLGGFGERTLDPIRAAVAIAFGMARGKRKADDLERGFKMWAERERGRR